MNPLVILLILIALSWLFNSNLLKLFTAVVFFALPVINNAVQPSFSIDFVVAAAGWWIDQLATTVGNYLAQTVKDAASSALSSVTGGLI